MKIAWLCPYPIQYLNDFVKIKNGLNYHPASWIVNLSEELSSTEDIELHIITLSPNIDKDYRFFKNNLYFHVLKRFYRIPLIKKGLPWYLPLDFLTGWYFDKIKLDSELQNIKPDLTHIHGTEGLYGTASFPTNKPHLVTVQGIAYYIYKIIPSLSLWICKFKEKRFLKKFTNFGLRTELGKEYIKTLNSKAVYHFVPEAINKIFFENKSEKTANNIVYVGDISKLKDIETLLESFNSVWLFNNNVKLNIIGNNNTTYYETLYKKYSSILSWQNIVWHGRRDAIYIKKTFDNSKIFVFPSLMDNSPNSLLEAMASGLICVASNAGGVPSLINNNETGFLFESKNSEELLQILMNIFNHKYNNQNIIKKGKDFVNQYYFPTNAAKIVKETYNTIISNHG